MNPLAPDLSALLGSRICHDLISPLGAIGNGVELLSMSGLDGAPEIALISESVQNANARIRFFRIAFGATGQGARLSGSEVTSILADLTRGSRLEISWTAPNDLPRSDVKLAFLLIQCLETAMPWGGSIDIDASGEHWCVRGRSDRFKMEPEVWEYVAGTGSAEVLTSSNVHFALVPETASRLGRKLDTSLAEGAISIRF